MITEIGPATLVTGDCRTVMAALPENCVDSIVCDPPYGLSFMGKGWDHGVPGKEFWTEALRVAKPGAYLLAFGGTRTFHRLTCAIEDAGWEIRDCVMWVYGSGFPKSHNGEWGGTALKPAWEPIILARKPLIGTVAANVQQFGTGGLSIDSCRITTGGINTSIARRKGAINHLSDRPAAETEAEGKMASRQSPEAYRAERTGEQLGRWPANLIHDGSDEVLECFPDSKGQLADAKTDGSDKFGNVYSPMKHGRGDEPSADSDNEGEVGFKMKPGARRLDTGSATRFFYCAKASKSDRNSGGMKSNHPTVKPTALMRYLCRLVTPPNGTILDPFMGSGSTGKAALQEGLKFVGIEISPEYMAIAERRISGATIQ